MLFDSHAHLDDEKFDSDRDFVIENLKNEGISLYINVGADMKSSENSIKLAEKYDFIYAAVGVHPHDSENMTEADLAEIEKMLAHKKVVALGEIGLDFYYDNSPRDIQRYWFKKQLELAKKTDMPVIVHCRDAIGECIEIIKESGIKKGVMHCFSGSPESAEVLLRLGWYISFSGSVTFKNAKNLQKAAEIVPIEKMFIETDSPYLSPEPVRGKRNNPANVKYVAQKIAEIKNMTFDDVAQVTKENAKIFFNIEE